MGKKRFKIDWKSKFIDLLIVIVGISIAFKLNTWNESNKANREIKGDYFKNPKFENIVFGYDVLLNQQIKSYSGALEKINALIIKIDANKK